MTTRDGEDAGELHGVAVGHAWHAAEPEDDDRLLAVLPESAAHRAVVDDARAVGAELALAVPQYEPPAELRARIVAAAAAEPVVRASHRDGSPDQGAPTVPVVPVGSDHLDGSDGSDARDADSAARPPSSARARASTRRSVSSLVLLTAAVVLGVVLLAGRALLPGGEPVDRAQPVPGTDPTSLAARAAQVIDDAEQADPAVRHAVLRDDDGTALAVVLTGGQAGSEQGGGQGGDGQGGDGQGSPRMVDLALADPGPGRSWVLWGTRRGVPPTALGAVDPTSGQPLGPVPATPDGGWRGFAVSQEPAGATPPRPSEVLADGAAV